MIAGSPRFTRIPLPVAIVLLAAIACAEPVTYDVVIRNGTIYDGSGNEPFTGNVAIDADSIVAVGDILGSPEAKRAGHPLEVAVGRDINGRATSSVVRPPPP